MVTLHVGIVSHIPVEDYAKDFIAFSQLVRSTFQNQGSAAPKTVAVDGNYDDQFTRDFLTLVGADNAPDIFTWHIYSLGAGSDSKEGQYALDPTKLDKIGPESQQVYDTVREVSPNSRVWLGEAGGAYDSGRDNVTNAFNSGFWFLDQMALMAANGHAAYCRQALAGGFYSLLDLTTFEPHPDYYSLLLYSRLMGPRVLSASSASSDHLRAYAHCTTESAIAGGGSVTVLLINLSNSTIYSVELAFGDLTAPEVSNLARQEYVLTSAGGPSVDSILSSKSVLLNGKLLTAQAGAIPDLLAVNIPVDSGSSITMAPLSYGFFVFSNAHAMACLL